MAVLKSRETMLVCNKAIKMECICGRGKGSYYTFQKGTAFTAYIFTHGKKKIKTILYKNLGLGVYSKELHHNEFIPSQEDMKLNV